MPVVRSLQAVANARLSEVQCLALIMMNDVDILSILRLGPSETWLRSKRMNSTLLMKGYQPPILYIVRLKREERRGGAESRNLFAQGLSKQPSDI